MLVYRRVTGLAGHTSRVSELLEQVRSCPMLQALISFEWHGICDPAIHVYPREEWHKRVPRIYPSSLFRIQYLPSPAHCLIY